MSNGSSPFLPGGSAPGAPGGQANGTPSGSLLGRLPRANGAPAAPAPAKPGTPAKPAPPAPRFGGGSPFGSRVEWHTVPVTGALARFELAGLGDPFHRVLARPLTLAHGDLKALLRVLDRGGDDVEALSAALDAGWQEYALQGAALLYTWTDALRRAAEIRPLVDRAQPPPAEDKDDDDDKPGRPTPPPADDGRFTVTVYRAIDPALVLNVLGRTRVNLLMTDAPLSFDPRLLERVLVTDDPRLVALARATGCLDEVLNPAERTSS